MKGGLLLDVVVRQGATILQLLTSEDQTLLIRRDAFLVLDLLLHVVDGVRWLDLESDGLSSEGLHEDLHFSLNSLLCIIISDVNYVTEAEFLKCTIVSVLLAYCILVFMRLGKRLLESEQSMVTVGLG